MNEVIDIQRMKAKSKGIDLKADFGTTADQLVYHDKQRVQQVLLNLQSNALKFTDKGSVTIKVNIRTQFEKNFLELSVIDTGIGIKEEDRDKLFTLFGYIKDSYQMNKHGIGLGLNISNKIVS